MVNHKKHDDQHQRTPGHHQRLRALVKQFFLHQGNRRFQYQPHKLITARVRDRYQRFHSVILKPGALFQQMLELGKGILQLPIIVTPIRNPAQLLLEGVIRIRVNNKTIIGIQQQNIHRIRQVALQFTQYPAGIKIQHHHAKQLLLSIVHRYAGTIGGLIRNHHPPVFPVEINPGNIGLFERQFADPLEIVTLALALQLAPACYFNIAQAACHPNQLTPLIGHTNEPRLGDIGVVLQIGFKNGFQTHIPLRQLSAVIWIKAVVGRCPDNALYRWCRIQETDFQAGLFDVPNQQVFPQIELMAQLRHFIVQNPLSRAHMQVPARHYGEQQQQGDDNFYG